MEIRSWLGCGWFCYSSVWFLCSVFIACIELKTSVCCCPPLIKFSSKCHRTCPDFAVDLSFMLQPLIAGSHSPLMPLRLITVSLIICSQFIYSSCFPTFSMFAQENVFLWASPGLFMAGNGCKRAVVSLRGRILACRRALSTIIVKILPMVP